jgi:selenocysteine lyase/cysteine desulfurase
VRWVDINHKDCSLDLDGLAAALGPRTRLVAFTLASNALGTITPAGEIVRMVRERVPRALVVGDAVHLAQHRSLDAHALGLDVMFCAPYKVFGPHLGVMYLRREVQAAWRPYKVRPQYDTPPDRWETGTLPHEALAGFVAAVDYLAGLGEGADRRQALIAAFAWIRQYELGLSVRFLAGLSEVPGARLYGARDAGERTPTFALRLGDLHPRAVAEELARRGIFVWDGNYFAPAIMQRLGLEATGGAVRVGLCHYNTPEEVDRVLDEIGRIAGR